MTDQALLAEIKVPVQQYGQGWLHGTFCRWRRFRMRPKMHLPSPLTCEDRTGALFEMGNQGLFHGERAVAVSAGQASRQHVTFWNELKSILFRGLMFTFQMNP